MQEASHPGDLVAKQDFPRLTGQSGQKDFQLYERTAKTDQRINPGVLV
jgi:hypothetical protein